MDVYNFLSNNGPEWIQVRVAWIFGELVEQIIGLRSWRSIIVLFLLDCRAKPLHLLLLIEIFLYRFCPFEFVFTEEHSQSFHFALINVNGCDLVEQFRFLLSITGTCRALRLWSRCFKAQTTCEIELTALSGVRGILLFFCLRWDYVRPDRKLWQAIWLFHNF